MGQFRNPCDVFKHHINIIYLSQLAWLDGVIKMTDDERTDLKPLEEEEV